MAERKRVLKKSRPTFDDYIMEICHAVSKRATCLHRDQGAVIVKDKHVISMGYNGAPPKVIDCLSKQYCSKSEGLPCLAEGLHGESNAIISAASAGISIRDSSIYCIYSPCRVCCNMIKTAGITDVYFEEVYDGFPEGPRYLISLSVSIHELAKP
jgi:dCMP deaminase